MATIYQTKSAVHYSSRNSKSASPPPSQLLAQISTNVAKLVECPREARSLAHRRLPSLPNFIHQVYVKCRMTPTLLTVALIYLQRLQSKLPSGSQGEYDTPYKLYLASVILASKFLEDSHTVSRDVFRVCAPVYSAQEISVMERSFLGVIKYNLFVKWEEITQFVQDHGEPISILELDL
ncbi:hypothetical protein LRAMOSA02231 [Lichtheimia ramosa]|uniref:Cyclin N-terminal domain-containing protein n=1 Tax=Lichtheimia ramosa TaxID=688394 RepID=A0A077WMB0_9FUNG|nr:hypothetical protein LRAMOSA02231 [Lichtheimia ramosa]